MTFGWPFSEMDPRDAAHEEHLAAQDREDAAADRLDDMAPAPTWRAAELALARQAEIRREYIAGKLERIADELAMTGQLAEIRDLPEAS